MYHKCLYITPMGFNNEQQNGTVKIVVNSSIKPQVLV